MTEQQRLTIRAELARAMYPDAVIEPSPTGEGVNIRVYDKPNETRTWYNFDPFTNAADKDALVAWLASQGANCRTKFIKHLARSIKIEYGVMEGWSLLSAHEESGADWNDFFLLLTAPLEAITLAAAQAVGIETE